MKHFDEVDELALLIRQTPHFGYYQTCGYLECYSRKYAQPQGFSPYRYKGEAVIRVFKVYGYDQGPTCDVYTYSESTRFNVPAEAVSIHIRQSRNPKRPNAIFFDKDGKVLPYAQLEDLKYFSSVWPPLTKREAWLYEKIHSINKYLHYRRKRKYRNATV